jgi:hypothetical protein
MTSVTTNRAAKSGSVQEETQPQKRVHLTLPPALHEKMKEVQRETNADTLVDVVKDALITYLALVKEHKRGKEIIVKDPESGRETAYALFMMRH